MGLLYSHYEANPKTNLNINAVSGTLTKTFKDSYFVRFEEGSRMEDTYFDENYSYRLNRDRTEKIEIIVLQVMLCGDHSYLVEAIDKEKYEKMFEKEPIGNND